MAHKRTDLLPLEPGHQALELWNEQWMALLRQCGLQFHRARTGRPGMEFKEVTLSHPEIPVDIIVDVDETGVSFGRFGKRSALGDFDNPRDYVNHVVDQYNKEWPEWHGELIMQG